ncbi:MAG: universal stress protein [Minwuia sp.]|nr:universal stress protein [Minwuia sp.]
MFKNVLLAIDLNHEASWKKALPEAVDLVRASGGTLYVMTILPDFGMSVVSTFFPKDFERDALVKIHADLTAFVAANVPSDISSEAHLGHGHVTEQILTMAAKVGADVIVMASHPPDELRDLLVGSNAGGVVNRSPISVLVIRG